MLEKAMTRAILAIMENETACNRLGDLMYNVVRKAVDDALTAEVNFIDGKDKPGRQIEKTVRVNMIEWLCKYIPDIEARLLGVQDTVQEARNNSAETNRLLVHVANIDPAALARQIETVEVKQIEDKP